MKTSSKMGLLALVALVATVVFAQQVRRTATADFGAKTMEWFWDKYTIEAVGDCWLEIKAQHQARLTAPTMVVQHDEGFENVQKATAAGPVKVEMLTAPDDQGRRRKIVASCTRRATYDRADQTVVMEGDAKADVTTLPEGEVEAAHFTGEKMTADLKNNKLTVTDAHLQVTTEIKTEKGEQ
jgi:lipopolysaccharide export system protein LptA